MDFFAVNTIVKTDTVMFIVSAKTCLQLDIKLFSFVLLFEEASCDDLYNVILLVENKFYNQRKGVQ